MSFSSLRTAVPWRQLTFRALDRAWGPGVLFVSGCLALAPSAALASDSLTLEQVLERGLSRSPELLRDGRRIERDRALITSLSVSRLPQLALIGTGSFTQVGTSFGFLTNLPTLGDLSLQLRQSGYAVLQNTFGNLGLVLDVNLLPLRQGAELAASRSVLAASSASRQESERQVRFDLIRTYRTLQLHQTLVPVWEQALQASTALERDAEAIQRRGLAARIDVLRARVLRAADVQGLTQARAQLLDSRQQLATLLDLPLQQAPLAADPLQLQPAWSLSLEQTLERSLADRPLLQALQAQQQAQRQQARAARLTLLPSLSLLVGGGLSADRISAPVLNQGGSLAASPGSLPLPELQQQASLSGSFYNWGAALLLRQPLYDGGRAAAAAAVAERERGLLEAEESVARRRIREAVTAAWSSLQEAPMAIAAATAAVQAGEQALRDARLRYRALVEPLTEVLLVQRDLQVARASLAAALTRQAIARAALERETGPAAAGAPDQGLPDSGLPDQGTPNQGLPDRSWLDPQRSRRGASGTPAQPPTGLERPRQPGAAALALPAEWLPPVAPPAEARSAETRPSETRSAETLPAETRSAVTLAAEARSAVALPAGSLGRDDQKSAQHRDQSRPGSDPSP